MDCVARQNLEQIYQEAIEALAPRAIVPQVLAGEAKGARAVPEILAAAGRLRALVVGKAAFGMALALAELCPDKLKALLAIVPHNAGLQLSASLKVISAARPPDKPLHFAVIESSHPLPDQSSVKAAKAALDFVGSAEQDEAVILAISGGASAMMAAPVQGVTLEDKVAVTRMLLRAGASIHELNIVRKHISAVKGGRLLQRFKGQAMVVLAMSDVIDNDPATIGSGPACGDPTTFRQAREVLERYSLWGETPQSVRNVIERGIAGLVEETLKPNDPLVQKVTYVIAGDNSTAVEAARASARKLGYNDTGWRILSGEAREVGAQFGEFLAGLDGERRCVVTGGETVVTVRGDGRGGRAQELALACALALHRKAKGRRIAVLSAGSDGIDGPTDAAGAFATSTTVAEALERGLEAQDFLKRNDAYTFFSQMDALYKPGPTGVNVADLLLALVNY